MKTIAFIPVRKGSKGIPGKNTKPLGNKPLLFWILDSLVKSNIADEIWVATDCNTTENLVRKQYFNHIYVYRRSDASATDTTPTITVVQEFLSTCNYAATDYLVLLQATSPFTTPNELKELKVEIQKNIYDSYIACTRLKKFLWNENGTPSSYTFNNKPRRQEYKGLLLETGAYYASKIGYILNNQQLISGKIKAIEISSLGLIDIDEPDDWELADYYIKKLDKEQMK